MFGICAELGASCERTSIDEAYLDVSEMANKLLQGHVAAKTAIKVEHVSRCHACHICLLQYLVSKEK